MGEKEVKVETKTVKLSAIKPNPNNPRKIKEKDMALLVKSLTAFPEMMELREIVVDEDMIVLGGNMRLQALQKIGAKEATAKVVKGLTAEQKRKFMIKDNSNFGFFDIDQLADTWADLPLTDWGVDFFEHYINEELKKDIVSEEKLDLAAKTADEAIEAMTRKIQKIAIDNPKQMAGSIAVIINNGQGNSCLFLADPNTADIVKELKRLADAGEHSPLEALMRSLL